MLENILDLAEKKIFQISNKRSVPTFVQLDVWLKKTFQHLATVRGQQEGITGVPTGFNKFDQMTSGMQRGDMIVLAARPSMGKTTLALDIARQAAMNHGTPTVIFSLEMSSEQIIDRMLSAESFVNSWKLRTGQVKEEEDLDGTTDIPCAIMSRNNEITLLQLDGDISEAELIEAVELAKEGCHKIYEIQKEALKEKYKEIKNE